MSNDSDRNLETLDGQIIIRNAVLSRLKLNLNSETLCDGKACPSPSNHRSSELQNLDTQKVLRLSLASEDPAVDSGLEAVYLADMELDVHTKCE